MHALGVETFQLPSGQVGECGERFILPKLFLDPISRSANIVNALFGALAQLGERMAGSHEVRGSIPLCSTIKRRVELFLKGSLFGLSFGLGVNKQKRGSQSVVNRLTAPTMKGA